MKKRKFFRNGIFGLCFMGLVGSVHYSMVHAAEEWVPTHEKVMEPTKVLMNEIAGHINNMLHGLLTGNYKYIVQEAGAVVNQSYKVNEVFFPVDPKENEWFKRAKIDPSDSEKITKLKEEFTVYLKEIASSALEVQKAASSYDEQATFKSFTKMVEKSCFECHKQLRDKQIPIENR